MKAVRAIAVALIAVSAAACSSSSGSSGGLLGFGGDDKPAATASVAPVANPLDKAVHVGWTIARAEKCGFFFDSEKIRTSYIAYEAQQGLSPADLDKRDRAVRFTRAQVTKKIAASEDYCSKTVLEEVRADLPQMVAGNFGAPPRRPKKQQERGMFDWLDGGGTGVKHKSIEEVFEPKDTI